MQKQTPRILAISMFPQDLKAALDKKYGITDYTTLGGAPGKPVPAAGYNIAATMGVFGIDASTMDALPDLKLVACNGAGLEKIDLVEARTREQESRRDVHRDPPRSVERLRQIFL